MLNKNKELLNLIKEKGEDMLRIFKEDNYSTKNKLRHILAYIKFDQRPYSDILIINKNTKNLLFKAIERSSNNKVSIKLNKIFNFFYVHNFNSFDYFIFDKKEKYKKIYDYIYNNFNLTRIFFTIEDNKYLIKYFDLKSFNTDLTYLLNNYDKVNFKLISIIDRLYNSLVNYRLNDQTYNSYYTKKTSIGRILKQIIPNVKVSEISNFIDNIRLILNEKHTGNYNFNIIEGYSIPYYYNKKNYIEEDESSKYDLIATYFSSILDKPQDTLNKSCMRSNGNSLAIEFYATFPDKIKLAILTNEDNKLLGRCLIWHADDDKIYYDRIFYNKKEHFLEISAKLRELGYINCSRSNEENYCDKLIKITLNNKNNVLFTTLPYFDTMKQLYITKDSKKLMLSNRYLSRSEEEGLSTYNYNNEQSNRYHNFITRNIYNYSNPLKTKNIILNDLMYDRTLESNSLNLDINDGYTIKYIFDKKAFVVTDGWTTTYDEKENRYVTNKKLISYISDSTNDYVKINKICYIDRQTQEPRFIEKPEDANLVFSLYYNAYISRFYSDYNHDLKSVTFDNNLVPNHYHPTIKNRVEELLNNKNEIK